MNQLEELETDLMLEVYKVTFVSKKENNNDWSDVRRAAVADQNIPMKTNDLLCMNYVSDDCVRIWRK